MAEPTPTTSDRDSRSPGNEDRAKEGYKPGGSATTIPLNPSGAIEGVENLPPEPEPRIKDPASTISVNTATSFGGTTPLPIGAGRTMKQVIDLARERGDVQKLKKQEIFINLSTPLNIKTKHGEVQAGPGDIVMRVGGHHAVFSQDAFEELEGFDFSTGNWDNLLRETLKRGVIARRLDDGNRLPMTPEQEAEADENIEREVANAREARDTERARKQKLVDAFSMQGKEGEGATVAQVWKPVDSSEGPPTATPSETATLVPQAIPIEVIDAGGEAPPPEQGEDATGATAGSPGSFTPSGATPAADLAGLSACTASPTTPWTEGQHVVLGDNSHAYWDGTTWQTGDAPPPIVRGGGSVPQSPNVPQARR
jgi:hypothetical protein